MTTYTAVFGDGTVPPSNNRYVAVALDANTTFYWSEQATGSDLMADIMEVTPSAAYDMTFPDASVVSNGRDVLIRNLGAFTITLKDSDGGAIGTVDAGVAKYVYITDNSTAAGAWTIFTFGTGTSAADAAVLAGYGLVATGATLSQQSTVISSATTLSVAVTNRSDTIIFTNSGTVTCNLPAASTAGNGFFVNVSNQGTGTVTIDGSGSETIDGETTKDLAPGESCTVVCNAVLWASIGYGRSTQFQFTKLVLDISTGAPFTLTSIQAANKLIQTIGTITAAVTINVPAVVAVYYIECAHTGAFTTTIKTSSGTGVALASGERTIIYCDGVNVVAAQTASAPAANLSGGSAGAVVYQSATGVTGFTGVGTTGHILVSGGVGAPNFGGAAIAPAGLVVSGGNTTTRGITDNATATALTLSGSGAKSVTIANSASNPTIGTSAGSLQVNAFNGSSLQVAEFASSASAVNYLKFQNRDTGVGPIIWAEGADTNIPLELRSKGSGSILLITGGASGSGQVAITHTASATRYLTLTGAAAGGTPTIGTSAGNLVLAPGGVTAFRAVAGSGNAAVQAETSTDAAGLRVAGGTNSAFSLYTVGTGSFYFASHGDSTPRTQVAITATASADRYITLTGSNGGNPKIATSAGSLDIGSPVVFTGQTTGTTVGAAGAASALPANPLGYLTVSINGTACKIPYYN